MDGTGTWCIVSVPADCLPSCSVYPSPCPALLLAGRRQLLARPGSSTQAFLLPIPVPLPLLPKTLKIFISQICFTELCFPWALQALWMAWHPLGKLVDIIVTQTSDYLSWIHNFRLDNLQNVFPELFLRLFGSGVWGALLASHLVLLVTQEKRPQTLR